MLSSGEEQYILKNAKIPEHIPALMAGISRADLFLVEGFSAWRKTTGSSSWVIPWRGFFRELLFPCPGKSKGWKRPLHTWLIAPEIPLP